MSTTSPSTNKKNRRIEFRTDEATDELLSEAAAILHVTKSAFIVDVATREAEKIVARADQTLMDPAIFDAMMESLDVADDSPELDRLAQLPPLLSQ